jgi:hypothetical protein
LAYCDTYPIFDYIIYDRWYYDINEVYSLYFVYGNIYIYCWYWYFESYTMPIDCNFYFILCSFFSVSFDARVWLVFGSCFKIVLILGPTQPFQKNWKIVFYMTSRFHQWIKNLNIWRIFIINYRLTIINMLTKFYLCE